MGHLVGIQSLQGFEPAHGFRKEQAASHEGATGVFHAAREEIVAIDLSVFVPREGHSYFLLEEVHDGHGVAEGEGGLVFFRRRDPEGKRHLAGLGLQFGKMAGCHRYQIVHMGLGLAPAP